MLPIDTPPPLAVPSPVPALPPLQPSDTQQPVVLPGDTVEPASQLTPLPDSPPANTTAVKASEQAASRAAAAESTAQQGFTSPPAAAAVSQPSSEPAATDSQQQADVLEADQQPPVGRPAAFGPESDAGHAANDSQTAGKTPADSAGVIQRTLPPGSPEDKVSEGNGGSVEGRPLGQAPTRQPPDPEHLAPSQRPPAPARDSEVRPPPGKAAASNGGVTDELLQLQSSRVGKSVYDLLVQASVLLSSCVVCVSRQASQTR